MVKDVEACPGQRQSALDVPGPTADRDLPSVHASHTVGVSHAFEYVSLFKAGLENNVEILRGYGIDTLEVDTSY